MTLLCHLRGIEEGDGNLDNADGAMNTVHLKVYGALISIAPYRHQTPNLV